MPIGPSERALHVAMFTPWRGQCGISDYSRLLVDALRLLPEAIASLRVVEAPADAESLKTGSFFKKYRAEMRRYQALGVQMNGGENSGNDNDTSVPINASDQCTEKAITNDEATDIAHVQHQYFFFGGVAPHKNHARAFLNVLRVPVVLTVHEIARPPEGARLWLRQGIALTNRRNFLHPAIRALIVHTQRDRETLLTLGVPSGHVHVVTHGTPSAAPLPSSDAAKHTLGLTGRRVVTLFGFLAAKKGHLLALKALKALPSDVTLVFAGGQHPQDHTDYVRSLRETITGENLQERVRITGYLKEAEIPTLMAATDVAIAPFLHSSGSGSLANLFAYGRAVVASDISAHQEIAAEMPEGLELFASGDSAALARHIEAILKDAALRTRLQQAVLAYAARHSYLAMARQTTAIYQQLTDR